MAQLFRITLICLALSTAPALSNVIRSHEDGGLVFSPQAYCEGEGCPRKTVLHGWDVWISPNVALTHGSPNERLGRALDILAVEFLFLDKEAGTFAIRHLKSQGVSFYLADAGPYHEMATVPDAYWPCGHGGWVGGACYYSALKRIGLTVQSIIHQRHNVNTVLHELAHAFHHLVVPYGYDNACIIAAYNDSLARGKLDSTPLGLGYGMHINRIREQSSRPYSAKNAMEYFAVATETFYKSNNQFPHNSRDQFEWDSNQYWMHEFWLYWHVPDMSMWWALPRHDFVIDSGCITNW